METEPAPQHVWLQKLVGSWSYESDCAMGPDQPRQKFNGFEHVRMLGDLWTVGEGEGEMPGGIARTMMTIGYNPQKRRFVATWIGSMMTHMWVYEGALSADETTLTLQTTGPDFSDGNKTATYQDIITLIGHDHRTLTSRTQTSDGKWHEFMTAYYQRAR